MPVVINTNFAATVAANNLAASNDNLQKSLNRLSSGSKIVSPADDAGGLAVAMKLTAAAKRQGAVATNIGNAVSFLQTQDGVLKVAGKVLDRMGELKTLYTDPTKSASSSGGLTIPERRPAPAPAKPPAKTTASKPAAKAAPKAPNTFDLWMQQNAPKYREGLGK